MDEREGADAGLRVCGFYASVYLALSYIVGIVVFLCVLKYPEITSVADKLKMVTGTGWALFLANVFMYVLFGPALVCFTLALESTFAERPPFLVRFSAVIGYIWAGSLVASGMISNAAIALVAKTAASDPERAGALWETLEAVSTGIGNGNGEILGGLMTIGFSLAILSRKGGMRTIGIWGTAAGAVGLLSVVPALEGLTGLFGIMQLVWFVALGASFLPKRERSTR